ncbi:MAG TPA: class A beta-lactamase-related serine hydrolase [Gammaproteobacteria bacterium]|nr:class A beta-lactamase-related serine hydrolase [Gammaproteobacteria bacterium]HIP05321.1 class A beta-lactamase-related serine hydrolase [Gammaproteobacteria bacterium]
MDRYVDAGKLPCALTLICRHGEVVFARAVGQRDLESGGPIEMDSIFRIFSMSKPLTSVAVMMLYEEGIFQLDDPISRFIPCLANPTVMVSNADGGLQTRPANGPITIKQLLTHTAGFTYGWNEEFSLGEMYQRAGVDFWPNSGMLAEVVEKASELPLLFEPGSRFGYGISTDVLGRFVEVISEQPLDVFMRQRVFEPLGMTDTGFSITPDKLDRLTTLYEAKGAGNTLARVDAPGSTLYAADNVTTFSGGGGLLSTPADYLRFTEMLRCRGEFKGGRLLGSRTVDFMTQNHLPGDLAQMGDKDFDGWSIAGEGVGFGLGFSVVLDPVRARTLCSVGEFSWGGIASTVFWVDPTEDITAMFLTQLTPSSTYKLRRELRVLTYQALVDRSLRI